MHFSIQISACYPNESYSGDRVYGIILLSTEKRSACSCALDQA